MMRGALIAGDWYEAPFWWTLTSRRAATLRAKLRQLLRSRLTGGFDWGFFFGFFFLFFGF